jgi:hypothetical protein
VAKASALDEASTEIGEKSNKTFPITIQRTFGIVDHKFGVVIFDRLQAADTVHVSIIKFYNKFTKFHII